MAIRTIWHEYAPSRTTKYNLTRNLKGIVSLLENWLLHARRLFAKVCVRVYMFHTQSTIQFPRYPQGFTYQDLLIFTL